MRRVALGALAAVWFGVGSAQGGGGAPEGAFVGECVVAAAGAYSLPPAVLVILLNVENGRVGQVSGNSNHTVDIGPMQVNDTWVPKIAAHWRTSRDEAYRALRDEVCANIEGGAWILRQMLDEAKGDFWQGVGFYHSHSERLKADYLRKVFEETLRLRRQAGAEMAAADPR